MARQRIVAKARKGRAQMASRRLGTAAVDISHGREGRVHQDDARAQPRVEMIVDLGGVEGGDRTAREQAAQKIGAGLGQGFVANFSVDQKRSLIFFC
jgi:hypothetical protein